MSSIPQGGMSAGAPNMFSSSAADLSRKQLEGNGQLLSQGGAQGGDELKQAFTDFVGQTLFSQMIKAARETQQKPAYMHGGRAEEVFQGQLDQVLSEQLTEASAEQIADPMYELFMLKRQL